MKDVLRSVVLVFLVCALAAGSLSFVYKSTKGKIADQARLEREEAMKQVYPEAKSFTETVPDNVWTVGAGSADAGAAGRVMAVTAKGYGGPIAMVVGIDAEKRVTGIKVMSHTETPGLGAKITRDDFQAQFKGLSAGELVLKKDDPAAGRIDAISAATITSRAVTAAVRTAVEEGGN